jgi:uncharacterized protein YjgD (DUF1641 family)
MHRSWLLVLGLLLVSAPAGTFQGMSKTKLAQVMNDPEVKAAIKKGLTFLGENK